jgi:hypothetical protein
MHNQTKTILALLVLTALAAVAYAQTYQPSALDVIIQINDARAAAGFGPNYTLCKPWDFGLKDYPPYKFAAGKNFTLIIREIARDRKYGDAFRDYNVTATANGTGFVRFNITIPADVDVSKRSDWYIAIVVEWPKPGYYFLVYNLTLYDATLIDVVGNLSGRIDRKGTEINNKSRLGVIRITHGTGRFGNLSSSAIHTFYVGVNTRGKLFDLTLTRTVTIAGTTITLDDNVDPAREPTKYVRGIDERITSVFGPFTYLGTYVTSLGKASTDPREYRVSIDHTKIRYAANVTIKGTRGSVIQSSNDIYSTYANLVYVSITLNMTTGATVPMSCGLVVWEMEIQVLTIRGLLDLKGNPIFNPEHFRFKIQMKMGDNWVTFDWAQGSWKLDLADVKAALNQVCGTISHISDIMNCYRTLGPDRFREEILKLYEPVRLVRFAGLLKLTNDKKDVVSTAGLTAKLVVEYSYTAGQDSVKATVLEVALAEPGEFTLKNLTVSVLPVQIRLWRWSNKTLPPSVTNPREYFYTDPLDLASLRFVVEGGTMYINRMAYDGAISYDPWLGQVVWTLPPYQPVPGLVGNVKASLLTLFNASGYLPMPPLVGNLTRGGRIQYFNYTDAAAKASFFKQFMIGVVGSYSYKFRIYWNNALVGTANIVAYYPVINSSGLLYHSKAGDALQPKYDDNNNTDMYTVEIVQPGRFYDREHVIHIAIATVFQSILLRDACGNPVVGVSAEFAGASISFVMNIGSKNITIARPVGSEVFVDFMVPIDEWGNMVFDLKRGYNISAYAVLNYFGYRLYLVDNLTKLPANEPVRFNIPFKSGVVHKPVLYLPIAPLNFRVWSRVVSVDYTIPKKEPLIGFVVGVFNNGTDKITRGEIARSISNKDGYAYVPNIPIGVPIRVVVRTIVPSEDKRWPYTSEQRDRKNDYVSYVEFMTGSRDDTKDVYTLGTRGRIDSGLVVRNVTLALDKSNATKYICAKEAIDLEVEVFDLVVSVFDYTGERPLRSQPVFLGPYPGATRPFLLNVTLVLADDYSPYDSASRWRVADATL